MKKGKEKVIDCKSLLDQISQLGEQNGLQN